MDTEPSRHRRAGRASLWVRSCVAIGCLVLAAACSSGSGDSGAEADDPTRAGTPTEGAVAEGGGDDGPSAVDPTQPVCDIVEPVIDDLVAAAALDASLTDDSPRAFTDTGCDLQFEGSGSSVTVTIGRAPEVITTVEMMASGLYDVDEIGAAPSLGDDARLIRDNNVDAKVLAVFSGGGQIWQVAVTDASPEAIVTDLEGTVTALSEVVLGAVGG